MHVGAWARPGRGPTVTAAMGAQEWDRRLELLLGHVANRRRPAPLSRTLTGAGAPLPLHALQAQHSSKPEVIFETDGRHSNTYRYEPPMGARKYAEPIDEVLDLGVDTIS